MPSSTCRRKARCIARSCASGPRCAAIELDPVVRLHYVEVAEPDMHDPAGDLQRLEKALREQWGMKGLDTDLRVIQGLQKALRQGEWKVTVAVHHGTPDHRGLAGLPRQGLWARRRHRLDHHRRPSLRSGERRGRRLGRADESPDPLRRGSDEPGQLCDDESRRRCGDDQGRARGAEHLGGQCRQGSRRGPARDPRGHLRRQSDHASSAARHRSDGAGRGALRAGDRRGDHHLGLGDRAADPSQCPHLRAALHRRPCRRRYRRRHPVRGARTSPTR